MVSSVDGHIMPAGFAPSMVAVGERTRDGIRSLVFLAVNKDRSLTPMGGEKRMIED